MIRQAHEEHARHGLDARAGADDLQRRTDGVRGGVGGARDHAVGEPGVDHHRGEVGDVENAVAGHVHRHALVLAQLGVLDRELLSVLARARVEELRPRQVDAQLVGAAPDGVHISENRQVGHVTTEQTAGRVEDAVVVALGKNDVTTIGTRTLEELVLEHLRRHHVGGVDAQAGEQLLGVDVLLHQTQCRLDLAARAGVDAALGVRGEARGVVGAVFGADDGQRRPHAVDQPIHGLVRPEPAVPDHPRQRGEALGRVRAHDRQHRIRAVGRDDHHHAVDETLENPVAGHSSDHHRHDLAVQQRGIARVQRAAHRLHELTHRGRREEGQVRKSPGGHVERVELGLDRLEIVDIAPIGDHADRVGMVGPELIEREAGVGGDLLRLATRSAEDQQDGGAEIHRECRVEIELGGTGHSRVVGSEDHHDVTFAGHHLISVDDLGERRVAVLVDAGVGDADAVLVVEIDGGVLEQHLENPVPGRLLTVGAGRDGDRAEDTDALHGAGEDAQQPQRDGGLTGVTLGSGDEHRRRRERRRARLGGDHECRGVLVGRVGVGRCGRAGIGLAGFGHEGIVSALANSHTLYRSDYHTSTPDERGITRCARRGVADQAAVSRSVPGGSQVQRPGLSGFAMVFQLDGPPPTNPWWT